MTCPGRPGVLRGPPRAPAFEREQAEQRERARYFRACEARGVGYVDQEDALGVACPRCNAPPELVCRTPSGAPLATVSDGRPWHAPRWHRVEALREQLDEALDDEAELAAEAGNEILELRAGRLRWDFKREPMSDTAEGLERGLWRRIRGPHGTRALRSWRARRRRWLERQAARAWRAGVAA